MLVLCRCAAALSIRKEPLCVAAIEAAEALGYFPPSLDQVKFVIDRIRDEKEVEDMLRHATFTKQQEDVEEALKAVAALKLDEAWCDYGPPFSYNTTCTPVHVYTWCCDMCTPVRVG